MPWGDNGVTNVRHLIDQSATVNWGSGVLRVPTQAFRQSGYLRRLRIKMPITATTLTEASGAAIVGSQAAVQNPAFRAIQSLDVTLQGIAPLYQLGHGADLRFLEYLRNGKRGFEDISFGALADTPASNVGEFQRAGISINAMGYDVSAGATFGAFSQNVRFGALYDLPLTEWVKFPATVAQGPNGPVSVAAQDVEVGLVTLQNTQQSVVPHVTLNPLFSATTESPFLNAGTAPSAGVWSAPVEFWTEFYDVPPNPADQPPAFSQAFVISRTSVDDAVSGGNVTHNFQAAGMLMRAIYTFYDSNLNLVDVSQQGLQALPAGALAAQGAEGTIQMKWGSTVIKATERFTMNLARLFDSVGEIPPVGMLAHDFFSDRRVTDMINTATLTGVQTIITGLPNNVATMHTIEERMIPVRLVA